MILFVMVLTLLNFFTPLERKAATEGACIDVCAQCSAVRERKAEEQAMINAIMKMLLSQ